MAMMTDSNSSSNPFTLPHVLEIHTSVSNCSLDVSVLSVDSSCSSFGSMSQLHDTNRKPGKKVHKRRQSYAKFNQYKGNGRWNNTVDAFGSAGMNTAPFRKPSYNRLSNPKLQRMSIDVAANVPCRKCSNKNLAMHAKQLAAAADGPANVPTRQQSNDSVSDHSGNRATAALNFHLRKNKNKNFQWKTNNNNNNKAAQLNARTCPPMIESVFSFNPPSPMTHNKKKKNPPAMPARRESIMEFNILNNFQGECTCSADKKPVLPPQPSMMMPPPIPARKESLMDFDDLSSHGSSNGQILPPPLPPTLNSSWSPHRAARAAPFQPLRRSSNKPMGNNSDPTNGLGRSSDHSRHHNMFLAMPPMTKFERQASATTATAAATVTSRTCSPPPMPKRRASIMDAPPSLMVMPIVSTTMPIMPPTLGRQTSSNSTTAPTVPQRKESLMDINEFDQ